MYNSLTASQICSLQVKLKCNPWAHGLRYLTNSPLSQPLTKLKIQKLCQSIGFGEAVVECMHRGSFNRVSKLNLASGDQCVIRVPRDFFPETTPQNGKDQVAINSYTATLFPVPKILAYDNTVDNVIESPYAIQELAFGQCLDEFF